MLFKNIFKFFFPPREVFNFQWFQFPGGIFQKEKYKKAKYGVCVGEIAVVLRCKGGTEPVRDSRVPSGGGTANVTLGPSAAATPAGARIAQRGLEKRGR